MLIRGGFRLTKFTSNYKSAMFKCTVPSERRSSPEMNLDPKELPSERAFVVQWFVETDELGFKIRHLNRPQTKRGILSAICSLYDLRGFAALETITTSTGHLEDKVELGLSFERGLPRQLRAWVNQLPSLAQLRIPRCYFPPKMGDFKCKLQLHIFSDVSEAGYGASANLGVGDLAGFINCSFVMGKARNAPVTFVTILRLELQAALPSTRIRC